MNRTAEIQHIARGDETARLPSTTSNLASVNTPGRNGVPVGGNVLAAVPGSGIVGHGMAAGGDTQQAVGDDAQLWKSEA